MSTPSVAFTFGGISTKSFAINSLDFNTGPFDLGSKLCVGAIMGSDQQDVNGVNFAIIGDTFIKNWYTVFSYDALNGDPAVGFAQNR